MQVSIWRCYPVLPAPVVAPRVACEACRGESHPGSAGPRTLSREQAHAPSELCNEVANGGCIQDARALHASGVRSRPAPRDAH
eukprot:433152-Amphidinium_carterae.1